MNQSPFTGGNYGRGERFPTQNESNSQFQTNYRRSSLNPEVNMNPQKPTFVQRPTPSNLPVNRGTIHIFYKTRMCQKFAEGTCRNGDKCTFADGPKDLREPPPNWQELVKDNRGVNWNDDQKIIQRMRICRKFYNGDHCPYGDKCTFLHEKPDKFKVQPPINNSVIKIESLVDHGQSQAVARQSVKTDGDGLRAYVRTSELHMSAGCVEGNVHPYGGGLVAANTVPSLIATEPMASSSSGDGPVAPQRLGRGFLKLANKKLIGIYADWIDDEVDDLK